MDRSVITERAGVVVDLDDRGADPERLGISARLFAAVLESDCVQRYDLEDAVNQLLGRDPEQHRPLRLGWTPLIQLPAERGIAVAEEELIALPLAFEFSKELQDMGKASGIDYMAQRFGAVFAIAIASAVFTAEGQLGTPVSVTAGFRPALWVCAGFAVLAALSAIAIDSSRCQASTQAAPVELPLTA